MSKFCCRGIIIFVYQFLLVEFISDAKRYDTSLPLSPSLSLRIYSLILSSTVHINDICFPVSSLTTKWELVVI